MSYPHDDIFSSNSARNRAVLVSERTQLLLIKVLQSSENRAAWEDTTDGQWDDIDEAIGQAEYEVLTEDDPPLMSAFNTQAGRTTTQSLVAATPTAIIWNTGSFDPTNTTRLYPYVNGQGVVTARVQISSGVNGLRFSWIMKNGASEIARIQIPVTGGLFALNLAIADSFTDTDYFELMVQSSNAATVLNTPIALMSIYGTVSF